MSVEMELGTEEDCLSSGKQQQKAAAADDADNDERAVCACRSSFALCSSSFLSSPSLSNLLQWRSLRVRACEASGLGRYL